MDALVTKINAFAPRSDQLFGRVASLETKQRELFTALSTNEEHWEAHEQAFRNVQRRVQAAEAQAGEVETLLSDKIVHPLTDHSTRLQQMDAIVADFATKTNTNEAAQRTLSGKFHSVAAAFAEQIKQQREHFQVCYVSR